jgi:hypothetical protein
LILFRKLSAFFLFIIAVSGCTKELKTSGNSIYFEPERSAINYVLQGQQKLLTVEYVLINDSKREVGPFTMKVNITNSKLLNVVGGVQEVQSVNSPMLSNSPKKLAKNEKHGYGFTFEVKNEIPSNKLREIIEKSKSLEIQLIDESGKLITSQWIQKLNVVQ